MTRHTNGPFLLVRIKAISKSLEKTYTLADITISSHNGDLARKHDIRRTLDAIDERLTATIVVVELRLGDRIVHIDGRDFEFAIAEHLVKVVDTRRGLFRNTLDVFKERRSN